MKEGGRRGKAWTHFELPRVNGARRSTDGDGIEDVLRSEFVWLRGKIYVTCFQF